MDNLLDMYGMHHATVRPPETDFDPNTGPDKSYLHSTPFFGVRAFLPGTTAPILKARNVLSRVIMSGFKKGLASALILSGPKKKESIGFRRENAQRGNQAKLRARLAEYYAGEGAADHLVIEVRVRNASTMGSQNHFSPNNDTPC
jgi:hypothetical protein